MKKTAVDVYEEKSIELINFYVNGEIDVRELLTRHHNIYYDIKELEKQQIIDAHVSGYNSGETGKEYYNETYDKTNG